MGPRAPISPRNEQLGTCPVSNKVVVNLVSRLLEVLNNVAAIVNPRRKPVIRSVILKTNEEQAVE